MKGGRIEVCAIGPHQRPRFGIQGDRAECGLIPQRPKQLAVQNGLEVDHLFGAVLENHGERVRPDELEPGDSMDGMDHGAT